MSLREFRKIRKAGFQVSKDGFTGFGLFVVLLTESLSENGRFLIINNC